MLATSGLSPGRTSCADRPLTALIGSHQIFEHVGVVDSDLQHHAAWHPLGGITPRRQIDLAQPVAADVGFGVHHAAELACVDLLSHPPEMALAAALISQRQHDACTAAACGQRPRIGNGVSDGLVQEHVLSRLCRRPGRFQMDAVGRGVDHGFDTPVLEHGFIAWRRIASVLGRKSMALLL